VAPQRPPSGNNIHGGHISALNHEVWYAYQRKADPLLAQLRPDSARLSAYGGDRLKVDLRLAINEPGLHEPGIRFNLEADRLPYPELYRQPSRTEGGVAAQIGA
jgi:hypothetical protein